MSWDDATWATFEAALEDYRDREYLNGRGEQYYVDLLMETGSVPIIDKANHAASIALFLNRWRCHLSRPAAEQALAVWILERADTLGTLQGVAIDHPDIVTRTQLIDQLHSSLIGLKSGNAGGAVPQMGVACASKILHLMIPNLFVMWDDRIRRHYKLTYGSFMCQMHSFARRISEELAPYEARTDVEAYLQARLGYPVKKSLAKYIDEYNWFVAWHKSSH